MFEWSKPKKKKKLLRWFLVLLVLLCVAYYFLFSSKSTYQHTVTIDTGDTFGEFLVPLSFIDSTRIKLYSKLYNVNMNKIQEWTYEFSWSYTPSEYLEAIQAWVEPDYQSYTVLEGWSIYDIDQSLSKKNLIDKWDYIEYVRSQEIIRELSQKYGFLEEIGGGNLKTLEGFLYPDTYFIDESQWVIKQLVSLQLDNFQNKVWDAYEEKFTNHFSRLKSQGFTNFDFSLYDALILSTVVEKEERNDKNKSTIAGLFYNRLQVGERIDADITLCYGLEEWYETCTPSIIVKHLYDDTNVYNTRAVFGLPPTPIANPSVESVLAVLDFKKTDYFFYLHDPQWNIHFGKTISEHNANKSKYLN